jgi:hypothetical protein
MARFDNREIPNSFGVWIFPFLPHGLIAARNNDGGGRLLA